MISWRVAPTAFRMPISLVRSVTEIIMIPMTPIPPTISPTEESASMIKANTPMNVSKISMS